MFTLRLFGGLELANGDGRVPPAALQRRRLALLALLALAGRRGMPRTQVQAHLWPDRPDERARHALEQLLYLTRRDLGRDAVVGDGLSLRLNPDVVDSDLARFEAALGRGDLVAAAHAYTGPVLDGVRLADGSGVDRWVDEQRAAWAHRFASTLERLAAAAQRDGAAADAVAWWRRRVALDPYCAPATLGLMRALVAAGDAPGAVRQARIYETLVRDDLALPPDEAVGALAVALAASGPVAPEAANEAPTLAGASTAACSEAVVSPPAAEAPAPLAPPEREDRRLATDERTASAPARARRPLARRPLARRLLPLGAAVAALLVAVTSGRALLRREARAAAPTPDAPVAAPSAEAGSLAVLPLADLSADRESDYFGDGLTEELIHSLSRVPELRVVARTSVFALRGRGADVRALGATLGVRSLVEGSVRRAGDRVRVNVRLVDAATGYERWSESYDRRLADVLAVQREIANAVTARLSGAGDAAASPSTAFGADTRSYAAFEHYLRGRFHLNDGSTAAVARAVEELSAAVAADPRYARAHAGLAEAYNAQAEASSGKAEQAALLARAEVSARRALALDPRLAEAHASLGDFLLNRWDWDGAAAAFRRAIAENPSLATAHERYGVLLALRGDFDAAVAVMRRAQELDPLSLGIQGSTAYVLNLARRYPDAAALARRLIAIDSTRESPHFRLGSVLLQQGEYGAAVRELETAARLQPATQNRALPLLGYAYVRAGRQADAERLRPLVERGLADHSMSPYFAAAYFDAVGEADRAFAVLSDLGSRGESCLRDLAVDPIMEPLRDDPRFGRVLRAVGTEDVGVSVGGRRPGR